MGLSSVQVGLLALGLASSTSAENLQIDAQDFEEAGGCLVAEHRNFDGYAEYLDPDNQVLARAGSWLGRDSRYLILGLDHPDYRVLIRRLDGQAAGPDEVSVTPCPATLDESFQRAFFDAQNLRLQRYLGESIASEAIDERFQTVLDRISDQPPEWQGLAAFEAAAHSRASTRYLQALPLYTDAIQAFQTAGDEARQAAATNSRGLVFWRSGELNQAAADFEAAATIRQRLGDHFGLAVIDNNLGLVLKELGDLDSAELALEQALGHFQGGLDLRRPINAAEVQAALAQTENRPDLPSALNTLNNLALLQRDRGLIELAERYWRNYLALEAHVPRAQAISEAQINLSRLLLDQGRIDEVLDLASLALERLLAADRGGWAAHAYGVLAEAYEWLGDRGQALDYLEQAVTLARGDVLVQAEALNNLAWLRYREGQVEAAAEATDQALVILRSVEAEYLTLRTEVDAAWMAWKSSNADPPEPETISQFEHWADRLDAIGRARIAAETRSRLAELLAASGRTTDAISLLDRVIERQEALGDVLGLIDSLDRLGRIQQTLDDPGELITLRRALDRIETIHASNLPPLRRAGFLAASRQLYDRLVISLIQHGDDEEAWDVAQRARGRGLRQAQGWRDRRERGRNVDQLLDQRAGLVEQHFVQVRLDDSSNHLVQTEQTRRALDRLDVQLERLRRPSPANVGEELSALESSLNENQRLISYYLAGDQLLVWKVESGHSQLLQLEPDLDLADSISELLRRARHPRQALGALTRQMAKLRRVLVEPLELLPDDRAELMIQPDGVLASLPLALLFDQGENGPQSLSQWQGRSTSSSSHRPESTLLLLADPGWTDASTPQPRFPEHSLLGRLLRDQSLGRLPGSRLEAEAIAELAREIPRPGAVTLRLGTRASREFVLGGGLSSFDRIHIASHGLVDLEFPELSSLLLGSESSLGPAFLRPHEIAELDIDAELVVLSGCETGTGRVLAGEGALSLARPFLIAGAEQVLASLWKIDDHRTAEFMQRFYQHLLSDGDSAARALSRAQNWMRRQPGTTHPYYWAGFILIRA